MDDDRSDVVGMCLEGSDSFAGVVVVYTDLTADETSATQRPASSGPKQRVQTYKSSDPQTIQFFRAMNRPARTGTSVSSKVLTICCVSYDQICAWPL